MTRECIRRAAPGLPVLCAILGGTLAGIWLIYLGLSRGDLGLVLGSALLLLTLLVMLPGLFTVEPNEAKVLQLFGTYKGTVRQQGLFFANPFFTRKKLTLRARNFETARLKVNDTHSNPVEIAAIVVWRVIDSAEALFEVENVETYVMTQSESALRALATKYPYDAHAKGQFSLSVNPDEIATELSIQLTERFAKAGVEVIESRVSHLAYAPEIAGVMLQRQQASAMVSNLLAVLCGERSAQPVLNTGTIYQ